jgi:outer membrane immunogenic protein
MRKLLLSSVALASMSAAAFAADLPRREAAPAPAPIYAAPIFTWSGFYVGLNAGVAFGDNNDRPAVDGLFLTDPYFGNAVRQYNNGAFRDDDNSGLTAGAQIGYNWQFGAMVIGLEADINYRDNGGRNGFNILGTGDYAGYGLAYTGDEGGNWFGTLRPRIGVAFDRTLLYVTGGLAYGKSRRGGTLYAYDTDAPGVPLAGLSWGSSDNSSNWGWTLGAGVEHAFSNNWTAKFEYLYVNLDSGNRTLVNANAPNYIFTSSRDDQFSVVRVGLNYKFGGPAYAAAPVLARY